MNSTPSFSNIPFLWRRVLTASLILVCFLLAANCFPESPNNYFNRIAMVSDGRITKFTLLPITVYVEGWNVKGKEYADDLLYALSEWENCSDGKLKFELVKLPDEANILVSWVTKLEEGDKGHPLGVSELQRIGRDGFKVEIRICLRDSRTGKPLEHEQVKTAILHEFGHAVGLWGHSKEPTDVMYYSADALHPTQRDINTLKLVYANRLDYSLHAESIDAIEEDLRLEPEDARLHFLLATIYADQEEYSQAIEYFRKCLNLDPNFHKASAALASAYRASGQYQSALEEYLSLAESDPSPLVHNVIGALYFEKRDTAEAIRHFKKAIELERAYEPARRNLYNLYLCRGNELITIQMYHEAIPILLDGVEFFPDKPELHNTLGTAYSRNGDFSEAMNHYRKALRINPVFMPARKNMALCYNNQGAKYAEEGMWEEAFESYNEALKLMPDLEEAKRNISAAYWNRALWLSEAGKHEEAIEAYKAFLKRDPNSREAHNNLGAAYFRVGDYDGAIDEFKIGLRFAPNSKSLRENLALAYHKKGSVLFKSNQYSQAIEEFDKGLKFSPKDLSLHLNLAQSYQCLEKWNEATQYASKALELKPDDTTARKVMANINMQRGSKYLQNGELDLALEYYRRVPDDLTPLALRNNIGYVYILKGMYLEAVNEIDRVLEVDLKDKTAYQNLLSMESRLKQDLNIVNANSQQTKDELLRVLVNLAGCCTVRENLTGAKKYLESAMNLKPSKSEMRCLVANGCTTLAKEFSKNGDQKGARKMTEWADSLKAVQ